MYFGNIFTQVIVVHYIIRGTIHIFIVIRSSAPVVGITVKVV